MPEAHRRLSPEQPCVEALSRKAVAESLDVHRLLYSGRVVTDCAPDLRAVPAHLAEAAGRDFALARTPPEIAFAVVLAALRWPRVYHNQYHTGWWGNYCQSLYDPASQLFYAAVGDHGFAARICTWRLTIRGPGGWHAWPSSIIPPGAALAIPARAWRRVG